MPAMLKRDLLRLASVCAVLGLHGTVAADEGMWPLEAFPSEVVAQRYGFRPSREWLDNVRLASARLAQGCSASFVSDQGLVLTNHHCARRCIEQLSTAGNDLSVRGFSAAAPAQERKCPALEVNRLESVRDVTAAMVEATRDKSGQAYADAKRARQATLERECASSDALRCDVVELYHGGQYRLYQYRRFQDVRLVFAPEEAAAFFGGDPDNFNFPRYDLDVALLRVYDNGAPARVQNYFKFSQEGAAAAELTFVSGHPGRTSRELTVAELEFARDVQLPRALLRIAELRGLLTEFQRRGTEARRISQGTLFSLENSLKAYRGRHQALLDAAFFASEVRAEQQLRQRMAASAVAKAPAQKTPAQNTPAQNTPAQKLPAQNPPATAQPWDAIAGAVAVYREIFDPYELLERGRGFDSELFRIARALVRAAEELPKPTEARLREFNDAALPQLKQELFSTAPIHNALEVATFGFSLGKLREILGADDPLVKSVLGKKSPTTLATDFIKRTRLGDVAQRKKLFEGGRAAIDASQDPLIVLARLVDGDARKWRKRFETEVDGVLTKAHAEIAKARFAAYGTSLYPDATFTLRLSYGSVQGWTERGVKVPPFTTFAGAFERHTGEDPFALPKSWLAAERKIALQTPLNFVTDNDIIGGNSGSPVINKNAEVVGLIFDGNIHSLGGEYGFDPRTNRAVAVHSSAILEALDHIYGAPRIAAELRAAPALPGAARAAQ